jgi:hypothetical protein
MTNEEMQRTMEFILDQQAQYVARMQRDESRLTKLEDAFVTLVQLAKLSDERLGTFEENMTLLSKAQTLADARLVDLTEKMTELAEAQMHTDERLNALIHIVDRNITKGGNGNAGD